MTELFCALGVALIGYIVGSVPTAYLMGKALKGIDIREHGSGNVGATNVLRVLGTPAGIATLAVDVLKGYAVVGWIAPALCGGVEHRSLMLIVATVAVIVGHNWMLFLGFTGGKGVATTAGSFLALAPLATLSAVGVWALAVALTRYVSLGSILAGVSLPLFMWLMRCPPTLVAFATIITVALVAKHRGNIRRLLAGTERKIGAAERVSG